MVLVRWRRVVRGAVEGGERCASFGRRQNVERTRHDQDGRGEFRDVDGKRPARRLVDSQGRFWDEERVEMRGLHVVQALKIFWRATSGGGCPHGASISPMGKSIGVAPTSDATTP